MSFNVEKIRNDFPILQREIHGSPLVYFDSAASTLKPQAVIDALTQHYSQETANVHRGIHFLSEQGTIRFEETRECVKDFINAKSVSEIIFTKGTTESINLVASSFLRQFVKEGDEILITTMEHHSNIVPWQIEAEKIGAKVIECPILDNGEVDMEAFEKKLNDRTKLVATCHISNTLGTVNPIKEMITLAHNVGAKFLVDAAQSVAHMKVDVQELDCDFLAFSGHKIFGPTGVGVLWGREELLEKMPPYQGGGAMISRVTIAKTTFHDLPNKFEAGTPHIAGVIGLKAAIDYVSNLGLDEIYTYEAKLLEHGNKRLKEIENLKIIGEAKNKASVISFVIKDAHPQDIGTLLDRQGVAVRTGHHCTQPIMDRYDITATTRASFSLYNTTQEIDHFIDALKKSLEFL